MLRILITMKMMMAMMKWMHNKTLLKLHKTSEQINLQSNKLTLKQRNRRFYKHYGGKCEILTNVILMITTVIVIIVMKINNFISWCTCTWSNAHETGECDSVKHKCVTETRLIFGISNRRNIDQNCTVFFQIIWNYDTS